MANPAKLHAGLNLPIATYTWLTPAPPVGNHVQVMTVNLTADHRQVYGAQAAEFLQTLKQVIESPECLMF